MGINSYYFNNIGARLWDVDNQDFWLTADNQGQCLDYAMSNQDGCSGKYDVIRDGLVLWMDISKTGTTIDGSSLTSLVTWEDATIEYSSGSTTNCNCYLPLPTNPTGITLCDWGLTGVDNGRFDRLSGITITLTKEDDKIILYPVTGYTVDNAFSAGTKGKYDYPWAFRTGSTTTDGCQVGETICLNGGFYQGYFKLDLEKPNPIKLSADTTTNNCGKTTSNGFDYNGFQVNNEFADVDPDALIYNLGPTDFDCGVGSGGWSMETWIKWDNSFCSGATGNTLNQNFTGNTGFFFYIGTRAENKFRNVFSGESGLYTCDGIIPLSPDGEEPVVTTDGQSWFTKSSYGRSCSPCQTTGTTNTITATTYCDELSENALGFRITPEGRVGYRKMTVDGHNYWCEESGTTGGSHYMITGSKMEEGYSPNFTISGDTQKWYHIVVTYSQNSVKNGLPAGTLKFWVNGRVVYRVEEFIGLKLRPLNDYSSKQLGVPYNISWGGGSQGLLESQTFGGPDPKDQNLPIATYFTGTFEGELSQLRFYDRPLNLLEIRNNLYGECNRYCVEETYGGALIKQPSLTFCDDGCKKTNNIIFSDTLGLEIDLTVEFSPGSIIAKYMADIKKPLNNDITLRFSSMVDVVSGDTITVNPEIFIPKGSTYGETTITINDDYDRITDKHDVIDFEYITEEKIKVKRNDKVIYKMPVKSSKSNVTPATPNEPGTPATPATPPTQTNDDLIVYYGKLLNPMFEENLLGDLNSKTTDSIVNSYIGLEEGVGYGYILIPKEMEQPTLFRNSNEGCLGFAIPMIDLGEITLGENNNSNNGNSNNNSNNGNSGNNQNIYKIYRTYVSTHANVDIWLCD